MAIPLYGFTPTLAGMEFPARAVTITKWTTKSQTYFEFAPEVRITGR